MDDLNLQQRFEDLQRQFEDHKHTGLDSVLIDTTIISQGSITARDTATVDGIYGTEEAGVINNNRQRILDIENALKGIGALT